MPVVFWAHSLRYSSIGWTKTLLRTPGFLVNRPLDLTCPRVQYYFLQIVARHLSYCLSCRALPFFSCRTLRSPLPPSRETTSEGVPMFEKRSHATCFPKTDLWLVHDHNACQWGSHLGQQLVPPVFFGFPTAPWRNLANREWRKQSFGWKKMWRANCLAGGLCSRTSASTQHPDRGTCERLVSHIKKYNWACTA